MTDPHFDYARVSCLTDRELVEGLRRLGARLCQLLALVLAHIAEMDARKLYADQGCSSMHHWCTSRLGLSEDAAFKRIRAARAARRFPVVLDYVAAGRVHLAGVVLLAPHLADDNHRELLEAAAGKSKRDVEQLVAERFPQAPAPDSIRPRPAPGAVRRPPVAPKEPPGGRRCASNAESPAAAASSPERPKPGPGSQSAAGADAGPPGPAAGAAAAPAAPAAPAASAAPTAPTAAAGPAGRELGAPAAVRTDAPPAPGGPHERPALVLRPPPARIKPTDAEHYTVTFSAPSSFVRKLREVQALRSHANGGTDADLASVLEQGLDLLRRKLMTRRFGAAAAAAVAAGLNGTPVAAATPGRAPAAAGVASGAAGSAGREGDAPTSGAGGTVPLPLWSAAAREDPPGTPAVLGPVTRDAAAEPDPAVEPSASPAVEPGAGPAPDRQPALPASADEPSTPPRRSRYIPAHVRSAAWIRDEGRCIFRDAQGRRCNKSHLAEVHHIEPFAAGGPHVSADQVGVLCAAHNQLEARRYFGAAFMEARSRRPAPPGEGPVA